MEFRELMKKRRSIRRYTGAPLPVDALEQIMTAGLNGPSGHNWCPWLLVPVEDPEVLAKLADVRTDGAQMLRGAAAAVAVFANAELSDTWIEDCAVTLTLMHLAATDLGIGSCWIQGRCREAADGRSADAFARELLCVEAPYELGGILSLGMPGEQPKPREREIGKYIKK